jgi:hypothetical protein
MSKTEDSNNSTSSAEERSALATPDEVAKMLRVPTTWVYSHQKEIPGLLRLGRYVRFRRVVVEQFLLRK